MSTSYSMTSDITTLPGFWKWKSLSHVRLFTTPWTIQSVEFSTKFLFIFMYWIAYTCRICIWNSPGQNTGVGSLSLLQGIFSTQRWNPGLPHCRQILYQLSHKASLRILVWVPYSFSSRSSRPRNQPGSPALQTDSLSTELSAKPNKQ